MAQLTQVVLTCDVHEGDAEAVDTVTFASEGQAYECELCEDHLAEFREVMEAWTAHARPVGQRGRETSGRSSSAGRRRTSSRRAASPTEVREWARAQGMQVSSRGRIPADVQTAYEAAH